MSVEILSQNHMESFGAFAQKSATATPFHTPAWMKVTADSFGFEPLYLMDSDADEIEGIFPLFKIRSLFGSLKLVSLPLRDKGGPIYKCADSAAAMLDFAIDYAKENKIGYIQIKTDDQEQAGLLNEKSFAKKDEWFVSYIKLDTDFNTFEKNIPDKRLNWSINKAQRAALEFCEASSIDDVDKFYSIFLENRKRLGVPPYSLEFFKNIYRYFIETGGAKLFFVKKADLVLTAIIIFLMKDKAYDVYSASINEAYDYRANDFQMYSVLKWLCDRGFNEYDLGADSPYQQSLLNYKLKWGAQHKKLYFYYYFNSVKDLAIRDSDHPKYKVLRGILKNTPDIIFEKVGSRLIKYLA